MTGPSQDRPSPAAPHGRVSELDREGSPARRSAAARGPTDERLIDDFKAGDVSAFNALVRRWESEIYNFITRYVGDREEACDLCQQTFIRTYHTLKRLREPKRFSTWLYQVAMNACRDAHRSRERRQTVSLDAMESEGTGDDVDPAMCTRTPPPDRGVDDRERRSLVSLALQSIPAEQRAVVLLKTYHGLTFTEIAAALEVPINTVKSRMYYGLRGMRRVLERWRTDEEPN